MLKNYFITALRNIKKGKLYSFINVAGLAIGMACCILILLWAKDELSYDRFHENAKTIYRVISDVRADNKTTLEATTPNPLGAALKEEYPEIVNFTRAICISAGGWYVKYNDKVFMNDIICTADPSFFEIFTFPFLKGNPKTALTDRYSLVLTEDMAKKYFGDEEPVGKVINLDGNNMKVTGVIKNIPHNSHLRFDCVFPIINMKEWWEEDLESWSRNFRFHTYIQLNKNASADLLNQKITDIVEKHLPGANRKIFLQPLTDIYLHSNFERDVEGLSTISNVYFFLAIAFCILLIACINFMNLATARSANRTKEIGLRKVVGAERKDIMKQFFGESILLSFIAIVFAVILVYLILPTFNALSDKNLSLGLTHNVLILFGLIIISLLTGFVSGIYPALYLSSFQPVLVLKKKLNVGKHAVYFRKVLIVIQFIITIFLVIATILINYQLRFINNKELGFDKNNIVYFLCDGAFASDFETVKNQLLQNPKILGITKSFPPIGRVGGYTTEIDWEGKEPNQQVAMHMDNIDYDYLNVFNMKMVAGRFFSKEFTTDSANFLVNETAAKLIGTNSVVGKRLKYRGREGIIVGVIKDFHQDSLHKPIEPLIFNIYNGPFYICIKIDSQDIPGTMAYLEKQWKKYVSIRPSSYKFLADTIDQFYQKDYRTGKIFKYFTFLAIIIAYLGLFGMASFMAEQKTKEIGIRKTLGSSIFNIVLLFLKDFLKLMFIAAVIAIPLAWYYMNLWLQNFSYRVTMEGWVFLFAAGTAFLLTLLAVGYQTIKASLANPVNSLRYE